jgi:hypothetical protein
MRRAILGLFFLFSLPPFFVQAQELKTQAQDVKSWAAKTAEYKQWLDQMQGGEFKFWTRLDGSRRPHKLYVGEGFTKADFKDQEQFVEVFSHYLAGHPDKYMLIDLYDARTGQAIGEFGWGGFKLFNAAHAENQDQNPTSIDKASAEKTSAVDDNIPAGDKPAR